MKGFLTRNARELASRRKAYDYLVLGAGSGGCAAAGHLARSLPQAEVAVVEAGPSDDSFFIQAPVGVGVVLPNDFPPAKKFNWGFEAEADPNMANRRSYFPRGCGLGGSSSINAMLYIRGHPTDYDDWAKQSADDRWAYKNVLPIFKQMEGNVRGESEAHGGSGPLIVTDAPPKAVTLPINVSFSEACKAHSIPFTDDFNGVRTTEGYGLYQSTINQQGRRCNAARAFLYPTLKECPNLSVATNTAAIKLLFDPNKKKVTGVRVCERSDKGKLSDDYIDIPVTKEVILAMGAFQSPQLLNLSGIGDPAELKAHGLEVVTALPGVGKNLREHMDLMITALTKERTPSRAFSPSNLPFLISELREYNKSGGGVLASVLEYGVFLKSDPSLKRPDLQMHFITGPIKDHNRYKIFSNGYSLHTCNLYPNSVGTVSLRSADPRQAPVIHVNFMSTPEDRAVMLKAFDITQSFLASSSFAKYNANYLSLPPGTLTDEQKLQYIRSTSDGIYHPVGTCKMGVPTDPTAVVDSKLRVIGVEGLRVADASIMPQLIGGNTNAPSMMIGMMCARDIAAKQ